MPPEDRLFVEVWNRLTSDWNRLTTFHRMGQLGESAAREAIHRDHTYFVEQQLVGGMLQHLLKDKVGFLAAGMDKSMPRQMTDAAVHNFVYTLDAATIVFAHSILDAAIFDCLRICAIAAPDSWRENLGARKVSLNEVALKSASDLLREAIESELTRLERESLLGKVDRTFQLCKPEKQEYLTNGFRFERDRLVKLDELRHNVVHDPSTVVSFGTLSDDLDFMQKSGLHIFSMVGDKFGLCFSGTEAVQALVARNHKTK